MKGFAADLRKEWRFVLAATLLAMAVTAVPNYFYHAKADVTETAGVPDGPMGDVLIGTSNIHAVYASTQIGFPFAFHSSIEGGYGQPDRNSILNFALDFLIHLPFGAIAAAWRARRGRPAAAP